MSNFWKQAPDEDFKNWGIQWMHKLEIPPKVMAAKWKIF